MRARRERGQGERRRAVVQDGGPDRRVAVLEGDRALVAVGVTVAVSVTGWPAVDEALERLRPVAVGAGLTWVAEAAEALGATLASPW